MTTEEVKQEIAQRAGIPETLLTGESVEENIAQAKAILAYKREHETQRTKTTQEQFSDWLGGRLEGMNKQRAATLGLEYTPPEKDTAGAALAEIEERARVEAGGYPTVRDGGSDNVDLGDGGSTKEHFASWIGRQLAFDPFNDAGGWG